MKKQSTFLKEIFPLLKIVLLCFLVCVGYILWFAPNGFLSTNADSSSAIDGINILININTATVEELALLPNIGKGKAEDIVAYRESHGDFQTIEDIQNVSGIGSATYEKIKDSICV